jgi:hypothetical protein
MKLVVVIEFAPYKKGDQITDPALVAKILASPSAAYVVQVGPVPTPSP